MRGRGEGNEKGEETRTGEEKRVEEGLRHDEIKVKQNINIYQFNVYLQDVTHLVTSMQV